MKNKVLDRRVSLRDNKQQWVSLAGSLDKNKKPQSGYFQELSTTVLTETSELLSSRVRRTEKSRYTDLDQFEKENFPNLMRTAETSRRHTNMQTMNAQSEEKSQSKIRDVLVELTFGLQNLVSRSEDNLSRCEVMYAKQIEMINQSYQHLHLMLDMQKNKHYNCLLLARKHTQSNSKIVSKTAQVYLQEIKSIERRLTCNQWSQVRRHDKSVVKYTNFLKESKSETPFPQLELGNLSQINTALQKIVRINEYQKPLDCQRRFKAQSMGPCLKPQSTKPPSRASMIRSQVIEEEGDLHYTDCEQSQDLLIN